MFSVNSGQSLPTARQVQAWWQNEEKGMRVIKFFSSLNKITPSSDNTSISLLRKPSEGPDEDFNADHCPSDRFMDGGNERLLNIDVDTLNGGPRASNLPPEFIKMFLLDTVFQYNLEDVVFRLALTALDYLTDFENTRKCCLREAAERLDIGKDNWRLILSGEHEALAWIKKIQWKELDVEAYYAKLFINLRLWIMVNELMEPLFDKSNLLALLNTLFPPSVQELPNNKIQAKVLHQHRASLYNLILTVEKHGPNIVDDFVKKHLRLGMGNSWHETIWRLQKYCDMADGMIKQSRLVYGINYFTPSPINDLHTREERLLYFTEPITPPSSPNRPVTPRTPSPKLFVFMTDSLSSSCSIPQVPIQYTLSQPNTSSTSRIPTQSTPADARTSTDSRHQTISNPNTPLIPSPLAIEVSADVKEFMDAAKPSVLDRRISTLEIQPNGLHRTISDPTSPLISGPFTGRILPKDAKSPGRLSGAYSRKHSTKNSGEIGRYSISDSGELGRYSVNNSGESARPWLQQVNSPIVTTRSGSEPSGSLAFLRQPYEPSFGSPPPSALKKTSIKGFFLGKKASATSFKEKEEGAIGVNNPLGIKISPSKSRMETEPFPRYLGEQKHQRPPLRHDSNFPRLGLRPSNDLGRLQAIAEKSHAPPESKKSLYESKPFEGFPGNQNELQKVRPQLQKQRSLDFLDKIKTRSSTIDTRSTSRPSPITASPGARDTRSFSRPSAVTTNSFSIFPSAFVAMDSSPKNKLRKKRSSPSLGLAFCFCGGMK